MIIYISLIILFAAMMAGAIPGVLCYDKIINQMYNNNHELWIDMGSPSGFMRKSSVPDRFFDFSAQLFSLKLFYRTPAKLNEDKTLTSLIKRYKMHGVIWITGVLLFFVLIFFKLSSQ